MAEPTGAQPHVERFIVDEVFGKLDFNVYPEGGAHAIYVARAAKALGLTVRRVGNGRYFFDDAGCVGAVDGMIPSLVSHAALKIARSKQLTKDLLVAADVRVPHGRAFLRSEFAGALRFFRSLGAPAVVKPGGGRGGFGITCDISTVEQFEEAWKKASEVKNPEGAILVEEMVAGIDLRVYVVAEEVVAATSRVPAHVVADGETTLARLIARKQKMRESHGYLARMPIVVDPQWIAQHGWTMESVQPSGQILVLNPAANIHQGGENVDVTGILDEGIRQLAVAAARAIPGMGAGGVDIIATSPRRSEDAVVLEVNTGANISMHHLPAYGQPVDVGRALVEAMVARAR